MIVKSTGNLWGQWNNSVSFLFCLHFLSKRLCQSKFDCMKIKKNNTKNSEEKDF